MNSQEKEQIAQLVAAAHKIVVIQADNPDGDSLASALALEHILGDMDKEVLLYCGVEIPQYLRYIHGWDRVQKDLPAQFDLSIIVDTSSATLLEQLEKTGQKAWLGTRPCIVIDHHSDVNCDIPYATVVLNDKEAVATGEAIYEIARTLNWELNLEAKRMLAISIMADSLGLISEGTTARTIHIIAELVEHGVSLAELDEARRELMKKSIEMTRYKGQLLQRIELHSSGEVATVTIPWEEIQKYSHEYNPSVLVLEEMRYIDGVKVAIAFKLYPDGKITGKVRCNMRYGIGAKLAAEFGGGGHPYASGFKVTDGRTFSELKPSVIAKAQELLLQLDKEDGNEVI